MYALDWAKMNEFDSKHLPVHLKKEVAKFPMMERQTAKESAMVLADVIQAIELNHEDVGQKHLNPYLQSKKDKEEEMKRMREEAEMKRLNATRQLRSAVDTFKDKREEKLKKIQEEKDE